MKRSLALLLFLSSLLAADYFPLEPGNSWTYQRTGGMDTFTISVGLQGAQIGGNTYYRLTGYVSQPLWVRATNNGLFYRNEDAETDALLTSFEIGNFWGIAPFRPCEQASQAARTKTPYTGPAGEFSGALGLTYRAFQCADAGVLSEVYLANLGLARREIQTIAGPAVYELVSAQIGGFRLVPAPSASFHVSVEQPAKTSLTAKLHLTAAGRPIRLAFVSAQEYNVALRDDAGKTLYVWSANRIFAPFLHEREVNGRLTYTVEIPLVKALAPGKYKLEGWITSAPSGREFAASTVFEVPES